MNNTGNTTTETNETPTVNTSESTNMKTEKNVYTLPANPNKAMQEMMETIDSLRTTLTEETAALKKADTISFLNMQEKKIEITSHYLDGMNQLIDRKDELKDADPTLKQKLEEMRLDFADITQENLQAIDRMKTGMKRLGERIMNQAQMAAKKHDQIIYNAKGHMQTSAKASMGVSESA